MSYGCIFAGVTIKTWSPLAKTINLGEIFTQSFAVLGTVVLTRHLRFSSSSLRACERLLHSSFKLSRLDLRAGPVRRLYLTESKRTVAKTLQTHSISLYIIFLACVAGRRKGVRKFKMSAGSEGEGTRSSRVCSRAEALVFPLSLPFGRLPRRLRRLARIDRGNCTDL